MNVTKIHAGGNDYLVCKEAIPNAKETAKHLLDRRFGIGADGLITVFHHSDCDAEIKVFHSDGCESRFCSTAIIAAAKFLYDECKEKRSFDIVLSGTKYHAKLSIMGRRVLCAWLEMPRILSMPLEQYKYYHGTRGEVLRACIAHPKISVYELCGMHTVFMLECCAALRSLNMQSVCRRLEEVLFFGESTDLHFAAIAGDNTVAIRSWRCRTGEISSHCDGAVLGAYAAAEHSLIDSHRIIVKTNGGNLCVEFDGGNALLCAKCETVFTGNVN